MRSTIIAAAFAASALAVPFQKEKRDLVTATNVDVVYVTDYTTVTMPYGSQATPDTNNNVHFGHGHFHHHPFGGQPPASPTPAAAAPPSNSPPPSPEGSGSPPSGEQPPAAPQPSAASPSGAAPSSAGSPTGAAGSSGPAPTDYSEIAVVAHNLHRKNHSASDITWDDNLASIAQTIASSCVYAHNLSPGGGGYGQNIAAGVSADNVSAVITDLFYNGEVNNYNGLYGQANPNMDNFANWGHFTQIVWKNTQTVGCYTQDCSGGLANVGGDVSPWFTVCNYGPPGNVAGEYGENVGEPLGEPTAQWNTGL